LECKTLVIKFINRDTGSFGSLQALPSWLTSFGELQPNGTYALSTDRKSIMNSIVWIGKIAGVMLFEPILERVGYRITMYICAVIQIIAIIGISNLSKNLRIVELTATNWIVFSVGRELAYLSVGIVENAVPSYQSEIAPAALRGLLGGSIMCINTMGNLWGAGMSRAYATETSKIGWLVPVGVQLIPAVGILLMVPFTPGT
jgi:MFS transporter, SP family, sugar:H+ symporter